jgi:hypothetical protein
MFRQVYRRQALMDSMMDVTDVNLAAAVRADRGQAFITARSKCRLCPHEQECSEWLATARPGKGAPNFCPNAQFFNAFKTDKATLGD